MADDGGKKLANEYEEKKLKKKKKKQQEKQNLTVQQLIKAPRQIDVQDDNNSIQSNRSENEEEKPQVVMEGHILNDNQVQDLINEGVVSGKKKQTEQKRRTESNSVSQGSRSPSSSSSQSSSSSSDARIKRRNKRVRHDSDSEHKEGANNEQRRQREERAAKKLLRKGLGMGSKSQSNSPSEERQQNLGLPQKTVFRDAEGKIIDSSNRKDAVLDEKQKLKLQKQKLKEANEQRIATFSKGMHQRNEKLKEKEKIQQSAQQEFTTFGMSKEGEMELINKKRFGDDMGKIIEQEDKKVLSLDLLKIQKKCKFPALNNRFNLKPGYRWDGVDRGNGFESQYFQEINSRQDRLNMEHENQILDL